MLQLQMPSHREVQAAVTYLHLKSHLTAHFMLETHIHGEEAFLPQSWHVEGLEVEFPTSSQAGKFRTRVTVKGECEGRACEDWPEGSGGITGAPPFLSHENMSRVGVRQEPMGPPPWLSALPVTQLHVTRSHSEPSPEGRPDPVQEK